MELLTVGIVLKRCSVLCSGTLCSAQVLCALLCSVLCALFSALCGCVLCVSVLSARALACSHRTLAWRRGGEAHVKKLQICGRTSDGLHPVKSAVVVRCVLRVLITSCFAHSARPRVHARVRYTHRWARLAVQGCWCSWCSWVKDGASGIHFNVNSYTTSLFGGCGLFF